MSSARPPARPRSSCATAPRSTRSPALRRSRPRAATPSARSSHAASDHQGQPERSSSTPGGSPRTSSAQGVDAARRRPPASNEPSTLEARCALRRGPPRRRALSIPAGSRSEAYRWLRHPSARETRRRTNRVGRPDRCSARLEVDTRLLGLIAALVIIWIGFNIMSGGLFLTPRNLWNLSVQSSSVAIMATGMVLDHRVAQHRPVGRIGPGFTGTTMAMVQTEWLPNSGPARPARTPGSSPSPSASPSAPLIGALPGLHHRLPRRPVLHRHPRRPARLGGPRSSSSVRVRRSRPSTRSSSCSAAGRPVRSARRSAGSSASSPASGSSTASSPAGGGGGKYGFPVRPQWAEVTLMVVGVRGASSARSGSPTATPGRPRWRQQYRQGPEHPGRHRQPGPHRDRCRDRHDHPRDAPALRPLRVRHRRQPRGGRARRHQHPPDHHVRRS